MCIYAYIYIYRIYITFHIHTYIHIYIYATSSSSIPVSGYLGYLHVLAIVNSAAMNIGLHISFGIMVFSQYMSRTGTAESYDSSIFSF